MEADAPEPPRAHCFQGDAHHKGPGEVVLPGHRVKVKLQAEEGSKGTWMDEDSSEQDGKSKDTDEDSSRSCREEEGSKGMDDDSSEQDEESEDSEDDDSSKQDDESEDSDEDFYGPPDYIRWDDDRPKGVVFLDDDDQD